MQLSDSSPITSAEGTQFDHSWLFYGGERSFQKMFRQVLAAMAPRLLRVFLNKNLSNEHTLPFTLFLSSVAAVTGVQET